MRYEHKFELCLGYENAVVSFLLCRGFREIFKKRRVNSLYYDDYHYSKYRESEDGISTRSKIRVRYYDLGEEGYNLEFKIKEDSLNWKKYQSEESKKLNYLLPLKFDLKNTCITSIDLPANIKKIFYPKVLVSYLRRYFISKDKSLRITIDYKIEFFKAKVTDMCIELGIPRGNSKNVLELKYDNSVLINEQFSKLLCKEFDFNLIRSSKYCNAINNVLY